MKINRLFVTSTVALLAFVFLATPESLLAATGDPLPGVDIFIRKKPGDKPSKINFGSADLPALPAGFFGPGSEPFFGEVDLKGVCGNGVDEDCDGDGEIGPHSRMDFFEGTTPSTIDVEMVALQLRSIEPIQVTNSSGVDSFFDITYRLSVDGLPPGEPVRGTIEIPPGETLSPGSSTFIVDSFFDIEYRIEFTEVGTGNPAGSPLSGSSPLLMEDPGRIPIYQEPGTLRVIPGSDGSILLPISYHSPGGGHRITLQATPEPGTIVLSLLGAIGVTTVRRRKIRFACN